MVYCGKPSKGCSACRERKVRCDQQEPACGQCEKRQQRCPGYRNLVDLMFRDESSHVIKKVTDPRSRAGRTTNPYVKTQNAGNSRNPSSTSKSNGRNRRRRCDQQPSPSSSHSATSPTAPTTDTTGIRQDLSYCDKRRHANGTETPWSDSLSSISSDHGQGNEGQPQRRQYVFSYYDPHLENYSTLLGGEVPLGESPDEEIGETHSSQKYGSPPCGISSTAQEQGIAFFFSRYVAIENSCHRFDFIYAVWKPSAAGGADWNKNQDMVTSSIVAVGLAGISKLTGCRRLMSQARDSYGSALSHTNRALQEPAKAVLDSTMLAVLILSVYEFLEGRTPETMKAWQLHVNGAAALASMRGTGQFDHAAGVRMFLMLCHNVLVKCIQCGLPMPKSMVDLRRKLVERNSREQATWKLVDPVYRALQTRYDINNGFTTDIDEILEQLTLIDDEFNVVLADLPDSRKYRAIPLARQHDAVFGQICHIYTGSLQVTIWNGLRTVRMLILETLLEQLYTYVTGYGSVAAAPVQYRQAIVKAMRMLEMLGDAIIASVPQHFGIVSVRGVPGDGIMEGASPLAEDRGVAPHATATMLQHRSERLVSPTKQLDPAETAAREPVCSAGTGEEKVAAKIMTLASASNTILWPLYILGMSASCSAEKLQYILERLDAIYLETNLEQACFIAKLLESKAESNMWSSLTQATLPEVPGLCLPLQV